jgi:hypothetical protein
MSTEKTTTTNIAKVHPIECQGHKDEKGKVQHAKGHTKYRMVAPGDKHQVTRCEECQKAHQKIASKDRRHKNAGKRRAKALGKQIEQMEAIKKSAVWTDLTAAQKNAVIADILKATTEKKKLS